MKLWSSRKHFRIILIGISLSLTLISLAAGMLVLSRIRSTRRTVTGIRNDAVMVATSSGLVHFFEPKPQADDVVYQPEWLSYTPRIRITEDTLNERYGYDTDKPEDTYRIVTLGDSWTYGQFVSTEENYSEVLETMLNAYCRGGQYRRYEVINLGVPGYDLEYAAERYRVRGMKYAPDLVIWQMIPNDFDEINEFLRPVSQSLMARGATGAEGQSRWNFLTKPVPDTDLQYWQQAKHLQLARYGSLEGVLEYQRNVLENYTRIYTGPTLYYLIRYPQDAGDRFLQFMRTYTAGHTNRTVLESTADIATLPDGHPSPAGHRSIASELFSALAGNYLPDCAAH